MKQSDAKTQAETLVRRAKLKQIRGRCCIFCNNASTTMIFGDDWPDAVAKLRFFVDNNMPLDATAEQLTKILKEKEQCPTPILSAS